MSLPSSEGGGSATAAGGVALEQVQALLSAIAQDPAALADVLAYLRGRNSSNM